MAKGSNVVTYRRQVAIVPATGDRERDWEPLSLHANSPQRLRRTGSFGCPAAKTATMLFSRVGYGGVGGRECVASRSLQGQEGGFRWGGGGGELPRDLQGRFVFWGSFFTRNPGPSVIVVVCVRSSHTPLRTPSVYASSVHLHKRLEYVFFS